MSIKSVMVKDKDGKIVCICIAYKNNNLHLLIDKKVFKSK